MGGFDRNETKCLHLSLKPTPTIGFAEMEKLWYKKLVITSNSKKLIGFNICGEYSKNPILIAKEIFNQTSTKFPKAKIALSGRKEETNFQV